MISIPGKIPIRIYPFFWLLALMIGWINSMTVVGTVSWTAIIVLSVLVHEYGHALTALLFGQKAEINLVGLGGLTTRQGTKLKLWQEFIVVLNGPIAGFSLAATALFVQRTFAIQQPFFSYLISVTILVNIFWTLVNLLPIQPLDGGRLLSIFLEALFGLRGVKISLFISMALSALLGLFFLSNRNLFAGALFLLFTFESYRSWRSSLELQEADKSFALQHLLKSAEQEMHHGNLQVALEKFMRIREMAKGGIIYQTATQSAAFVLSQLGQYADAFHLLEPLKKNLSNDAMRLYHHLAYDSGNWKQAVQMANEAFQKNPDYDTAVVNALAYGRLSEVRPAIGWLQCAMREGLPNLADILARTDFDSIRNDAQFLQSVEKFH